MEKNKVKKQKIFFIVIVLLMMVFCSFHFIGTVSALYSVQPSQWSYLGSYANNPYYYNSNILSFSNPYYYNSNVLSFSNFSTPSYNSNFNGGPYNYSWSNTPNSYSWSNTPNSYSWSNTPNSYSWPSSWYSNGSSYAGYASPGTVSPPQNINSYNWNPNPYAPDPRTLELMGVFTYGNMGSVSSAAFASSNTELSPKDEFDKAKRAEQVEKWLESYRKGEINLNQVINYLTSGFENPKSMNTVEFGLASEPAVEKMILKEMPEIKGLITLGNQVIKPLTDKIEDENLENKWVAIPSYNYVLEILK